MGKLSKYLFGIMAAAMLAGCSDDAISPDDNGGGVYHGPESSVYMQVTIVPTGGASGSRSVTDEPDENGYTTSNSGIEIGNEDENRIFNVMLILAGPNNEFISYALIGGLGNNNENLSGKEDNSPDVITTDPKNNSVTANASFSRASIEEFYNYAAEKKFSPEEVYVYALCNYTQDMLNSIKTATPMVSNWTNLSQRVDEYSAESGIPNTGVSVLSTTGGLYMANAVLAKKQFPAKAQDWDAFSDEKHPFDLSGISTIVGEGLTEGEINNTGAVRVERGMARFDFADGSTYSKNNNWYNKNDPSTWNTYIIGDQADEDGVIQNTLKVKLVRMCLVNMSNRFFYLRHMANTNGAEGQLAAAVLPDDGWIPEDPVDALASTFFLCVAERPWAGVNGTTNWENGNWVIDPYYTFKSTFGDLSDADAAAVHYEDYFNFPLGNRGFVGEDGTINDASWGITPTARQAWYTSKIADVLSTGREDQNYGNWSPDRYDYRIWRYVTENTIPSVANQKNAISTGIVFKGLLLPGDNCPDDLAAALNGTYTNEAGVKTNPNLYLYDEVLYVSWPNVEAEALAQKAGSPLYNAVYGNTPMTADGKLGDLDGSTEETKDMPCAAYLYKVWQSSSNAGVFSGTEYNAFRAAIVSNGFAIYQHSGDDELDDADSEDTNGHGGYFCYYYYWNRHNDNSRNGVMGPMEFQVVRNNVYKLAVTEISKLGHPRRTSNDPDPEEPKKDDEESNLYFKVQVEVLPWTVRVNNITF